MKSLGYSFGAASCHMAGASILCANMWSSGAHPQQPLRADLRQIVATGQKPLLHAGEVIEAPHTAATCNHCLTMGAILHPPQFQQLRIHPTAHALILPPTNPQHEIMSSQHHASQHPVMCASPHYTSLKSGSTPHTIMTISQAGAPPSAACGTGGWKGAQTLSSCAPPCASQSA